MRSEGPEAVVRGTGVECSQCGRILAPIERRRYGKGKRRARTNHVVGFRCPACGAGFNHLLGRDSELDSAQFKRRVKGRRRR